MAPTVRRSLLGAPEARAAEGPEPGASERLAAAPLDLATASDRFHDYVLEPYEPLTPAEGKLRSVNLLVESFAHAGVERSGLEMVRLLREGYGSFRTIWGIKRVHATDTFAWELYFYDFDRAHADCSLGHIAELLGPLVRVHAEEPWTLPWHMFSIELDASHLRGETRDTSAHVYIDMRSYALEGRRFTLENVYTFHDPRLEIDDVLHRLRSSVHLEPGGDWLRTLMPPALFRCGRICVANKRGSDALYFSRVPTPALSGFLDRYGWPAPLRRFVTEHGTRLDHLLWDVGVDFHASSGTLEVDKTGIYGSF